MVEYFYQPVRFYRWRSFRNFYIFGQNDDSLTAQPRIRNQGGGCSKKNPATEKSGERGGGAGWMVSRQWFFDSTIELAGFFPLFFSICINATEQRRGESRLLLYK